MPAHPTAEDFARLQARVAELEAGRARRPRQRPHGLLPAACLALLLALVPLGLLAANPFTDLTGGVHDANIDAIYQAGVTRGCVPDAEYCPTANVTREEMASFLARLGGLGTNPPVANAKTALTATNAAQLGDQPAAAYARRADIRVLQLINGFGPLPLFSPTFTVSGGTLLFLISGSAFKDKVGPMGLLCTLLTPTGNMVCGGTGAYTNEPNSHKVFPSAFYVVTVPAGSYRIALSPTAADEYGDFNDFYSVMVLELPAGTVQATIP